MLSGLIRKASEDGKDWGREEKRTTEDEMVGWHRRLNGHEFEWTPGVGDGQGGLACCSPWGRKELDTTEQLHKKKNTLKWNKAKANEEKKSSTRAQASWHPDLLLLRLCWVMSRWLFSLTWNYRVTRVCCLAVSRYGPRSHVNLGRGTFAPRVGPRDEEMEKQVRSRAPVFHVPSRGLRWAGWAAGLRGECSWLCILARPRQLGDLRKLPWFSRGFLVCDAMVTNRARLPGLLWDSEAPGLRDAQPGPGHSRGSPSSPLLINNIGSRPWRGKTSSPRGWALVHFLLL